MDVKFNKSPLVEGIEKRMKERGLSINALTVKAGLKPTALWDILNGKSENPSYTKLSKIAKVLDCSVEELYGGNALNEEVEVAGYIGRGARILLVKGEKIARPVGFDPKIENLWVVKGDDNYPIYKNGDMVVTPREYKFTQSLLGERCVVSVKDDPVPYIRLIEPGNGPNTYTLTGFNSPPLVNIEIEWALPIYRTLYKIFLKKEKDIKIG